MPCTSSEKVVIGLLDNMLSSFVAVFKQSVFQFFILIGQRDNFIQPFLWGTLKAAGGSGATQLLPRDWGAEKFFGDPTDGLRPKDWTRYQRWKKQCQK